tara:strand:+ start:1646 stop:3592 length:1947 start_codon:yes stop_codon:yes gene_type:complete
MPDYSNPDFGTNLKTIKKDVDYLGRDFADIRTNLIEFAKAHFPKTYNDFNETSPGMMFIEMAAYVGDLMNYYIDNQFRETLLLQAEERKNIFAIAQSYGYKPKLAVPATAELDFSVIVPATTNDAGDFVPDLSYAGVVSANSIIESDSGIEFTLLDDVNFKVSSSLDPLAIEQLIPSSGTNPTNYKLSKKGIAKSGTRETETFTFSTAKKFDKIVLSNEKVTEIISVTDSNGKKYYEVPFLAQDTIFESIENTTLNDPALSQYQNDTPFLLRLIKASKRFTTRVRADNKTELRFGSGVSDNADEVIIPNPDNVGSALGFGVSKIDESFDPSNFLKTETFGQAPANTTLTIVYNYGGEVEHNVPSDTITNFTDLTYTIIETGLDTDLLNTSRQTLSVSNMTPAAGGASQETLTEVKENAAAYLNTQNRAVTRQDYITRVYSLPQKFGNIAKAYIAQDEQLEIQNGEEVTIPNPLALNMYVLGYDENKNYQSINQAVKENLKLYLSQYRILTDAINIKNAFIINIAVKFSIVVRKGLNHNDVSFRAIQAVKRHFETTKWQINQPIILSDIANEILKVDGVVSVSPPDHNNPNSDLIVIENKNLLSGGYSGNVYDITSATRKGIVYPSLDPSIFEVKFPNTDIECEVVGEQ